MDRNSDDWDRTFAEAFELLQGADRLDEAMRAILPLLGRATGCLWGTYWSVDPATMRLTPLVSWSDPSVSAPQLDADTRGRALSLSEGNAGHVWRSQKPIWTTDILRDMCIPRSLDAASAGFNGGIWFAIKSERFVFGVVELLGKQVQKPTEDLLLAMERLGIRLGALLEGSVALRGGV